MKLSLSIVQCIALLAIVFLLVPGKMFACIEKIEEVKIETKAEAKIASIENEEILHSDMLFR